MANVQISQYNAIIARYSAACNQYVSALTDPKYVGERNTLVYPLTTYMWGSADKYGTQGMEDYNSLVTIGRTFLASFMKEDRVIDLTSTSGGSVLAAYLGVLTLDTAFVYNSQYPAGVRVTMCPAILRSLVQSGKIVEGAENAENFIQKFSLQDGGKFLRSKIDFNEYTIPAVEIKSADSQGTTFKLISRTITIQVCTGVIIPRMGMTVLAKYLYDAFSQSSMALKRNGLAGIYTRNLNLITAVYGKEKTQEIMQNLSRTSVSDTVVPAVRLDGSSQTTCIAYIDVSTIDAAVVYPLSQQQIQELAENSKLDVSQTRRYILRYLDEDQLSVDMMRQICVACAKLPEIKRLGNKLSASNPETYGARASAGMVKQACTELVLASYDAHLFSVLKEFDGLQGKLFLVGINQVSPHYGTPSVVWDSNSGTPLDKSALLRELKSGVCELEIATVRGAIASMICTKNGEALQKYIGSKYLEWEDKSTKFKMFVGTVRRLCDGVNVNTVQTMLLESKAEQFGIIADYNKAYAELVAAGKLKDVAIISGEDAELLLSAMNSNISAEAAARRAKRSQSGSYDGLVSVRVLTALQASEYIRSINISNIRKVISYR